MPLGRDHDLLREGRDTVDEGDLRAMGRLGVSSDEAALQGDRLDAVAVRRVIESTSDVSRSSPHRSQSMRTP